ncbi:hypothetical protein STEG23_012097, partial [Scotinomys teguina]
MQPGRTTNNGSGTMEVVAATPRNQLVLIVLMAVMLLLGMKVSPLLVQRTVTRTIGKELEHGGDADSSSQDASSYRTDTWKILFIHLNVYKPPITISLSNA